VFETPGSFTTLEWMARWNVWNEAGKREEQERAGGQRQLKALEWINSSVEPQHFPAR
jgi:hypothetical protein